MLGRKIARHGIAILVTALLGPLLAVTMVRLAPGFDSDEAQLDSHLNSESIQALRQERLQQHNILRFYFHSLRRAAQGDLGTSISLQQPVSKLLKDRAPLTLRIVGLALLLSWAAAMALALGTAWACLTEASFDFAAAGHLNRTALLASAPATRTSALD